MEFLISLYYFISPVIIFIFGLLLILILRSKLDIGIIRSILLYLWHTIFCLIYYWGAINFGGDAIAYYNKAQIGFFDIRLGTNVIVIFVWLLIKYLNLSLIGAFLVFNIIGSLGLVIFDSSMRYLVKGKQNFFYWLTTVIVFLPSVSLWSSAIGKDAIAFMAIALVLWGSIHLKKRTPAFITGIILMALIRPHVSLIIIISFILSVIFNNRINLQIRIILILFSMLFLYLVLPYLFIFAGLSGDFNLLEVEEYTDSRQEKNLLGGSSMDVSSMSIPEKLFAYFFRPSIFEIKGFFYLVTAIENAILFYIFFLYIKYKISNIVSKNCMDNNLFIWIYSLTAWLIFSYANTNLGISSRQKWMILPMLFFVILNSLILNWPVKIKKYKIKNKLTN